MARDTDRKRISEAIRLQSLWRLDGFSKGPGFTPNGHSATYVTDFDERLYIQYGRAGQVVDAVYTHWDSNRETTTPVSTEHITTGKRDRCLHLINQGRQRD